MDIVFLEGVFLPKGEAKIPITDRGFLFGDGAYATIQVRDGVPLFLQTHLERLQEQCKSFGLKFPSIAMESIEKLIALNGATQGIWRFRIFITGGDLLPNRLPERQGRLLMTLEPHSVEPRVPLKLGVFSVPFHLCHASFKTLAHLNRYYVMEEAHQKGFDDCVTLTEKGILLEAAFGNLFWVVGKRLYTPARTLPLYFGVTIGIVLSMAPSLGYEVEEVERSLKELPEGNYFRANTMGQIRPIASIGKRCFPLAEEVERCFVNGYEEKKAAFSSPLCVV